MNPPNLPSAHGKVHPVALSHDGQPILFPTLPFDLPKRAGPLMADEQVQRFVNAATLSKDAARQKAVREAFGDRHEPLRTLAGEIKQHTLDNLDWYLERFIDKAQAAGCQIHFAADAQQANAIALEIARRAGCTRCVKSKSMVTEETHLLGALEEAGIETLETDLGEFILQLDHDAPSHIVTPMIHKDRTAVARAFQRALGVPYTEDPQKLTMIARDYLRHQYRKADLGVSGANFLVAETGSLVICTNEGNGRFCTTAPRIHVAFVGIEKLVPGLDHLAVLLKLLAMHSTAQPLTVYTHILTGPRQPQEHDGPQELHVVLVDNGRNRILASPEYRPALRCIRCGACLNACPVYRKISGHGYGSVYSGPIGAVITPSMKGLENYPDLPAASSLCGACYEACPVKIDLPRMLISLRRDLLAQRGGGFGPRLAYKILYWSLRYPLFYRVAAWIQRIFLRPKADADGFVQRGPGPLRAWTRTRDFPAPARESFRQWWQRREK